MDKVLVEAVGNEEVARTVLEGREGRSLLRRYEFAAVRDSIARGENPIVPSLILSLVGVSGDEARERVLELVTAVDRIVLYTDFATSPLMDDLALVAAQHVPPIPVETRKIGYQSCL